MVRKLAWIAVCLIAGLAIAVLQFDREARRNPAFATLVPEPMRGFAAEQAIARGLADGGGERIYGQAVALVARRPVPSENLTLLSLAAARTERIEVANGAIILAAGRGWRDPVAQNVMVRGAIAAGEWQAAADRLTALWAARVDDDVVSEATSLAMAQPEVRAIFAGKLGENPEWQRRFVQWAGAYLVPDTLAEVVAAAVDGGAQFDCARLAPIARRHLATGAVSASARMWTGPCALQARPEPEAFSFASGDQGQLAGPFDWVFPERGGVRRNIRKIGERWVLEYENTEPLRVLLAKRYSRLTPGSYTVRLVGQGDAVAGVDVVQLSMLCLDGEGRQTLIARMGWSQWPEQVAVPPEGCDVQLSRLVAWPGSNRGVDLSVEAD